MATYKLSNHYTIRDVDGNSVTVTVNNDQVADATTIAAAVVTNNAIGATIAPLTNGKIVQTSFTILILEAQGVGTDAEFPLVSQQAQLHFSNSQGSRASFTVPAPKEAIFRAPPSDDIVDPAQADVAAFIAEFELKAADVGGNTLNLFQGGALRSRRRSRRRSIHS